MKSSELNFCSLAKASSRSLGFTLLELIVSIAVFGIIAGIAAPSVSSMLNKFAVKDAGSGIADTFRIARTTAMTEGKNVKMVPKNNDWNDGWKLVLDDGTAVGTVIMDKSLDSQASITYSKMKDIVFKASGVVQDMGIFTVTGRSTLQTLTTTKLGSVLVTEQDI